MFFRVYSVIAFIFLFVSFAAATTTTVTVTTYAPGSTPFPASQCNTGALWCCNTVQTAAGSLIAPLLTIASIVVSPVTALVGALCTGLVGLGSSCTAQAVCCQNNTFGGVIVIGCSPVNVGV